MSKFEKRTQAIKMRTQGTSITQIAKILDVSKSSASFWCRDIILTKEQHLKLEKNKGVSVKYGQRMGAEKNKQKRLDAMVDAEVWGEKMIKNISKRELLLIATALYWCEGSKSLRTSGFTFVNSDPQMVLIMKLFLTDTLDIKKEEIVCSVQINRIHENRINKVLNFWKKMLDLPGGQFRKPYFVNTKVNKVYDNYEDYYGICRIMVKKGMNWKYRMMGLIKALKNNTLSA